MPLNLPSINSYWYVATPYSKYPDGIVPAFIEACKVSGWLVEQGIKIYCPIAHTHPIAMYGSLDPYNSEMWLEVDAPLMVAAGGLIVVKMISWDKSYGVKKEIEIFTAAKRPVVYLEWPDILEKINGR